jgi:glucuronoarabinoxylan endo-1,4-beta-xylanase
MMRFNCLTVTILMAAAGSLHAASVKFEAESGVLGVDYTNGVDGATQFISIASNQAGSAPSNITRVATYVVAFPAAGTYELYGRVRVGPAGADDDSFFYANGVGLKSETNPADWVLVNSVNSGGFTVAGDVVTGSGSAGIQVWKWINFSQYTGASGETPVSFTVTAGNLTQTFQIGGREDGFDIDAFVFGTAGYTFTVSNLNAGTDGTPPPATVTGAATVNWADVRQRIDGFGASSAWRSTMSSNIADRYFSTNTGLGLSLLRTRIAPGGGSVETNIMRRARERGVRVWSAPWTATTDFKTTNANGVFSLNGGRFVGNTSNYQAYASILAGYVARIKAQHDVTLYALSVQNEPDHITTSYESCGWTAQQIHDFVPYLSAALAASNVGTTRIMIPESQSWGSGPGLYTTTMTDPNTAPLVGIIGNHNYVLDNDNGDQSAPAAVNSYGKALWETEVSTFSPYDPSITNAIYWAKRIHAFLTSAQVNAWHYWWFNASDNSGIADSNDNLAKRGYVLGQFSRFVRPDFYRVGVTPDFVTTLASAYKDPNSGKFAIVAINPSLSQGLDLTVNLNSSSLTSVTPWITSSSLSLAAQSAVTVSNGNFQYLLPPASVVTFVGQGVATNSPPTDIALSAVTVAENAPASTTVGAFSTTDPDSGSTFTYSLVSGSGSADNTAFTVSSNTLRTGTSFDCETKSSYSIRVRSSDQFGLSLEEIFLVTVTNVNDAPALAFVGNQTVNAGVTLLITNAATDQDLPPQTLTFTLLAAPTNATVNPGDGILTWRPPVSGAGSTNPVSVRVTDDGAPNLSATNSFVIVVNPLTEVTLTSISVAGGQLQLVVDGPHGPDYTLMSSSNLIDWQVLFVTNSPVLPLICVDTNPADAVRFYRIQLAP